MTARWSTCSTTRRHDTAVDPRRRRADVDEARRALAAAGFQVVVRSTASRRRRGRRAGHPHRPGGRRGRGVQADQDRRVVAAPAAATHRGGRRPSPTSSADRGSGRRSICRRRTRGRGRLHRRAGRRSGQRRARDGPEPRYNSAGERGRHDHDQRRPAGGRSGDQPAADQPTADQPTTDEPTADQPTADQPAADQPAADQPTDHAAAHAPLPRPPPPRATTTPRQRADRHDAEHTTVGDPDRRWRSATSRSPTGRSTSAGRPRPGHWSSATPRSVNLRLGVGRLDADDGRRHRRRRPARSSPASSTSSSRSTSTRPGRARRRT